MKKRIIILSILIILLIVLLIPLVVTATKNLIMYDSKSGKPIIVAGEEVPEELVGKEAILAVPSKTKPASENEVVGNVTEEINVVSPKRNISYSEQEIEAKLQAYEELEKNFDEIMYKYHGTEKINQVHAAMNNENPETDIITSYTFPESGKTLLRYVVEIFDTMNPSEEEKQVLREFSQMMVRANNINDADLEERINNL